MQEETMSGAALAAEEPRTDARSGSRVWPLVWLALLLLVNEWTVGALLASDGQLGGEARVLVRLVDLALVVLLVTTVAFRRGAAARPLRIVAVQLCALLVLVVLVEGGFALANHFRDPETERSGTYAESGSTVPDELLGYVPLASSEITSRLEVDGALAYDVTYTIDADGRRVTPLPGAESRPDAALFFGGSFTYGEGVEDDGTLPYFVGLEAPSVRPWNFGYWGWGPAQTLALFEGGRVPASAAGDETVAVYTFIDNHVKRTIGAMRVVSAWGEDFPLYVDDGSGGLTRAGTFASERPVRTQLYDVLSKSQVLQFLKFDLPVRLGRAEVAHTCRVLAAARDRFRELFGSERFYVMIYPGAQHAAELVRQAEALELRVLDYSGEFDPREEGLFIPGDRHPTPEAYRRVARLLVRDLGL